ncbi:MAG TPA: methyltransferase [Caulobacteraceae bacterium]|jgi:16S rRNA (guanine1207-N2)-methyltransferase|nr:methyltransferase [Caulobacteraceae bacterium]
MSCTEAIYGAPDPALAPAPPSALQVSPLAPGAVRIEDVASGSVQRFVVAAPAGAIERRYVLAQALRVLAAGGELIALAPKTLGGLRIAGELRGFGCAPVEQARRHQRLCRCERPEAVTAIDEAIDAGGAQLSPRLGLWSQPGVFSWDRLDPGSEALIASELDFTGRVVDLGCGAGVLARSLLERSSVTEAILVDLDRRALDAARRNIDDPRARFVQADIANWPDAPSGVDAVVMNPPFHQAGRAQIALGQAFVTTAARMLRKGGRLRLVANTNLPYEACLSEAFSRTAELSRQGGFKILEAVK